ncbi:hypothetical protein CMT56_14255 [Elizabethkingia anophelis]|uniref:hypothetical protein n=1 Tax=Elizabethkingia anophelis TaxID=1117645 RepID=UPI000994EE0D|nr:hypothetical protein [Elizabethkingia anophelis]AQW94985.1 hypothetical protein BBD30_12785 [Elizabethkingia anophelis]MCW2462278.1 hypothetical protein [Elizabethkingia anophelis]MCW2465962.1 hypothetical protein [Elizabethkingia anophelis]MCW2469647.1 hypothetical protein [Elizabethkingia anophelis]MDV3661823.1 hypothetical protein [Elizabethkingia anophelis]
MKLLKLILSLSIIGLLFINCSSDNNREDEAINNNFPITKIDVGEINPNGSPTKLQVTYYKANTCMSFDKFNVSKRENNVIDITILGSRQYGISCEPKQESKKQEFIFEPSSAGKYTLRFWAGKNSDNTDKFTEVNITIPENNQFIYGFLPSTKINSTEINPAGKTSRLMVTYKTTNTCQSFDQFQVVKNDNNIIELGVVGKQRGGNDCKEKEEEKIQEYAITPAKAGEYTFRFWAGKNTDNTDKFIEHKVVIPEK